MDDIQTRSLHWWKSQTVLDLYNVVRHSRLKSSVLELFKDGMSCLVGRCMSLSLEVLGRELGDAY